jgi:hypothetical protein
LRRGCLLGILLWVPSAIALTPEATEFVEILRKLEPVHCEKMKLRRAIALAEIEKRDADAAAMKKRFAELNRDPATAKLEKRLAVLESRISDGKGGARDPQDLDAISFQRRRAFYQCE